MAHKKGLGSSRNGRDSNAKRLGVKIFAGQKVKAGMIIVRQARGHGRVPHLGREALHLGRRDRRDDRRQVTYCYNVGRRRSGAACLPSNRLLLS